MLREAVFSAQGNKKKLCGALDLPRASLYRRNCKARSHQRNSRSGRALSNEERHRVLAVLHEERFVDKSPGQVHARLLDEGMYLCSVSTMYRILAANCEVKERRKQARRRDYMRPELLAAGPNQVWSWDITKLRGPQKWNHYYLYVILDIYSRYVVGWMVASRENGALAKQLINESCWRQEIRKEALTIHSDRGSSMTSKTVAQLLTDLGVLKSLSRPQVSNDNPFSESNFKTLKYHPTFPSNFGCIEDARLYCEYFFQTYNEEHYISTLAMMTPEMVHYHKADDCISQRSSVLAKAFSLHPERFVKGKPQHAKIPEAVWINPPSRGPDAATKCSIINIGTVS